MYNDRVLSVAAPGFLANDIDPEGEALTAITLVTDVAHGTLTAFPNGSFTYTPTAGYTGPDAFAYRMQDASGNQSDPINVSLTVVVINSLPVADAGADKTLECTGNGGATVLLDGSNSTDSDGDALTYTWRKNGNIIAGPSTQSTAQVFLAVGVHNLELTVDDGIAGSSTDYVTITVTDFTPPVVTTAFLSISNNRNTLQIRCTVEDACSPAFTTSSLIVVPTLVNPAVKFVVSRTQKLQIDMKRNTVIVQALNPQSFWNSIKSAGGVSVTDGQQLRVGDHPHLFMFNFDKGGKLEAVSGPRVVLRCTATDGSANTAMAEAVAPVRGNQKNLVVAADETRQDVVEGNLVRLEQNYPNPFTTTTVMRFFLPQAGPVRMIVYDHTGQEVQTLLNGNLAKGWHNINWSPKSRPAGMYYYRLIAGDTVLLRKMMFIR